MTIDARQPATQNKGAGSQQDQQVLQEISQALSGLRFGSVEIVVHEGKVTQIERKEKFRLQS